MNFKVSVIIPVYNAANYIRTAVESAVFLEEVGEVILIEDKSPDNALEICQLLETEFAKVRLFRHPNGENRGAGASRNLGIKKSKYDYIAFLDADDWYLKNRFVKAKSLFASDDTIDGVYESTGFFDEIKGEVILGKQTTVKKVVDHNDLLYALLLPSSGRFTTDAITIKKTVLEKTGLFDTTLKLHQDTHLWLRLAYAGKLVSGEIFEPVAMRRVHSDNRIAHQNLNTRKALYKKTFEWFITKANVDKRALKILYKRYIYSNCDNKFSKKCFLFAKILIRYPKLLTKIV